LVAVILAVLIGGLAGAYALTQTYYFVGRDGTEVAIFRGVNTQIGPLKFFNVYKNTDLMISDLNPSVRSQVNDGITANNKQDAAHIVQNLHGQLLPLCVAPTALPTTPPATPTTAPRKPTTTAAHTSHAGTAGHAATATPRATPTPTRKATPTPTPTPKPTPNPTPAPTGTTAGQSPTNSPPSGPPGCRPSR
jgi:protein phosphatase